MEEDFDFLVFNQLSFLFKIYEFVKVKKFKFQGEYLDYWIEGEPEVKALTFN